MSDDGIPTKKNRWLTGWRIRIIRYFAVAFVFGVPTYFVDQDDLSTFHPIVIVVLGYFSLTGFLTIWLYANEFAVLAAIRLYGSPLETFKFSLFAWSARRYGSNPKMLSGNIVYSAAFAYVSTIYAFALTYRILSKSDTGCFKETIGDIVTALYFSVITIATVGYGDIVPKTKLAKALVSAEVLIGVAYSIFFFSIIAGFIKESQTRQTNLAKDETT
jgi:hypothetical protein